MSIKMRMPPLASVRGQTLLTDTKPYLFRQSPVVAEMLEDMIVGGTVAWNQFLQNSNVSNASGKFGLTFTKGNDGFSYTLTGTYVYTSGDRNIYCYRDAPSISVIAGHVYLVTTTSKYVQPYLYGITWSMARSYLNNTPVGGVVGRASTSGNINMSAHCGSNIPNNTDINETIYQNLIDLTAMFGSTVADYVYSLEQSTAGSGIAWLKSFGFFTKDFYSFDSGSLLSVKTSAHETVKNGITHTYTLSDVELRGIPKLTDGNIVYDGDTYASDGTVTRKYGIVDLGALSWTYRSQFGGFDAIPSPVAKDAFVGVCSRFKFGGAYSDLSDNEIGYIYYNHIFVKTSAYTDANAFKTSVSGAMLVYELASATSETTDTFTNPQVSGTTEEYIDARTVPMPVGHTTQYFNMIQKESISMHMPTIQPIKMHMPTT